MQKNNLLEESVNGSLIAINLYKYLNSKNEFVLSKQFLRSSTSVGANLMEAKYAESRADFIHKFSIALKECNETLYWLNLIQNVEGDGSTSRGDGFSVGKSYGWFFFAMLRKIFELRGYNLKYFVPHFLTVGRGVPWISGVLTIILIPKATPKNKTYG